MKKFVCSTEKVTSKRVKIRTDGIILDDFLEYPKMFDCHDYSKGSLGVIGRWEQVEKVDGKLLAVPVFDMGDPVAAEIARKVEEGFVKGASIGIRPIEAVLDKDELGDFLDCTKCLLIEISTANIPSNGEALSFGDLRIYNEDLKLMDNWTFSDFPIKTPKQTMDLKKIAQSLGLSETATEAEILAAVNANNDASVQLTAFKQQQKALNNAEIIKLVDARIAENPALAPMRQTYITLGDTNFEVAKATLEALAVTQPQQVTLSDIARGRVINPNVGLQLPVGKENWTFTDWEKKDPTGLQQLRSTNPNGFEALYKQTYGIDFKTDISLVGAIPEK